MSGPPVRRPPRAGGYLGRDLVGATIYVGLLSSVALWWLDTPARSLNNRGELLIAAGRITGLAAGYLLLVTVALRSRVGLLERFVGSEALGRWHRELGGALVVAILGHAALILVGYAALDDLPFPQELNVLMTEYEDMTSAIVAVGILVGIGLLAIRAVRTVMPYELWKFLHLASYVVLLLAYGHQFADGQQLFRPGPARTYWIGLYVAVLACLAWGRVVGPLIFNLGHGFRVADVVQEGPDIVSIYLSGRRLRQTGRAGQFFRWRFLARGVWTQAHPFSLSAAPDGRRLRITVKAVGDYTRRLKAIPPGTRVIAEGPFGVFTTAARRRPRVALIAGGVGITPIRALLEDMPGSPGDITVVYRALQPEDVILRHELDEIAARRGAVVHYVLGDHRGDASLLSPQHLQQLIPDIAERDVYLCGPPAMTEATRASLDRSGVSRRHIYTERFAF